MTSAAKRNSSINPALQGTRYGEALAAAEKAQRERAEREAQLKAEWIEKHPECGFATPVHSMSRQHVASAARIIQIVEYSPYDESTWALLLQEAPTKYFYEWPSSATTLRRILKDQGFIEFKGNGKRKYKFRITEKGLAWLKAYQLKHTTKALDEEGDDAR